MRAFILAALMSVVSAFPCQAVESQRLTFSGVPEGSGVVEHVRVVGTINTFIPLRSAWLASTVGQNDIRISDDSAMELAGHLNAWVEFNEPFQYQVQRSTPTAAYSVTVVAPYGNTPFARVILQASSVYLDNQFGTVETANVLSTQSMLLTKVEGAALADGILDWIAGSLPSGAIFSKLVQGQ